MSRTRPVPPAMLTAMESTFCVVLLIYVDWPDAPVYAHTGRGDITFDGHVWKGFGEFGEVNLPSEAMSDVADEGTLTLAGTLEKVLETLDENLTFADYAVWQGVTATPGGNDLIGATPASVGYIKRQTAKHQDGEEYSEHAAQLVTGSGPSLRASAAILHSYEDQIAKQPGDTIMRHLVNIANNIANPQKW